QDCGSRDTDGQYRTDAGNQDSRCGGAQFHAGGHSEGTTENSADRLSHARLLTVDGGDFGYLRARVARNEQIDISQTGLAQVNRRTLGSLARAKDSGHGNHDSSPPASE